MKNPELDKHILMHFGIKNMRWGHRKGIGTPARTRKGRKRATYFSPEKEMNPVEPEKESNKKDKPNNNAIVPQPAVGSEPVTKEPEVAPSERPTTSSLQLLDEIYAKIKAERKDEAKATLIDRIKRAKEYMLQDEKEERG